MLNWFSRELQRLQEVKRDERGFTLIELLVVIIIIGILAAIAIPIFLNQRERAFRATLQSDLRGIATEAETYYTDSQTYAGFETSPEYNGFNWSQNVTPSAAAANMTATDFCVAATHSSLAGETWSFRKSRADQLDDVAC